MIKIISDKTGITFSDKDYREYSEYEIDDDATVTDMFDIFIHILRNEGYHMESVKRVVEEIANDGIEEWWH